jgi:protein-S-isoprenylcysteine O-methyltransferase Ste14
MSTTAVTTTPVRTDARTVFQEVSAQCRAMSDFGSRLAVSTLFALLSLNVLNEFERTGHLTGLLLLASESLVVVLTVIRRPALVVDRSTSARIITAVSVSGPLLVRAGGSPLAPDGATVAILAVGCAIVVVGKLSIGRSFGLMPANRGVVVRGPYTLVRHPIYAGYILTHVGFLLAHLTWVNAGLILVADSALIIRALAEERVLARDQTYREYCERVVWHLVPWVF